MQHIKSKRFSYNNSHRYGMQRIDNPINSKQHFSFIKFLLWGVIALVLVLNAKTVIASQFSYVLNYYTSISAFSIDLTSGKLSLVGTPIAASDSSKIVINSRHTFAYMLNLTLASISTYAIDQSTGELTPSGVPVSIPLGYNGQNNFSWVVNMFIDPQGKFIYILKNSSNPYGGNTAIDTFVIDQTTGTPSFVSSTIVVGYTGSPDYSFDPNGAFLYLSHATYGSIFALAIDQLSGTPSVVSEFHGSTYSKIVVHPKGEFAYATGTQVSIFSVDAITGKLTSLRDIQAGSSFSAMAIEPTGNFIYLVDGISNNIQIFRINQSSGDLTSVGAPMATGIAPTHIFIDKFGRFAYVTNSGSNNIYVFSLNSATGAMTLVQAQNSSLTMPTMLVGFSDATKPPLIITDFTIPVTSPSLKVGITSFNVSDITDVSGYCISETDISNNCIWETVKPSSYSFTTTGSKTLYAFAKDAEGTVSSSVSASITIFDTASPLIQSFTIPQSSTSLTIPITTFTATDDTGITDYCLTETNDAASCGWNTTAPTQYAFNTVGSKNLFAFAKDAAGNISNSASATIAILETYTVTSSKTGSVGGAISCTSPATQGTTTTCSVSSNLSTLTDNGINVFNQVVNGTYNIYQISTNHSLVASYSMITVTPSAGNGGSISPSTTVTSDYNGSPLSFTVTPDIGYQIANVSGCGGSLSGGTYLTANITGDCTVTASFSLIDDSTAPVVSAFVVPVKSSSLAIPITTFTVSDAIGVTGYMITENATKPLASDPGWSSTVPTNYQATSSGKKTLYAWAKDASGNVSASTSQAITISEVTILSSGWKIIDIGTLGGKSSSTYAINNHTQIVGYSFLSDEITQHAFLWENGNLTDLGTLGGRDSTAYDINDKGQIVGQADTGLKTYGFLWDNGQMANLGGIYDSLSEDRNYGSQAYGINNVGQIAGSVSFLGNGGETKGFIYQNGKMSLIDPGWGNASVSDINDGGTVLGRLGYSFTYLDGVFTNYSYSCIRNKINNSGSMVGYIITSTAHACLDGNDIGTLGGDASNALGLNNLGQVVGTSTLLNDTASHAFIYSNNSMTDINNLISITNGWYIEIANGINDYGEIIATASVNGQLRQVLLIPPDTILPTVNLTIPATGTSLTIPVTYTASDHVGVTGYCLTEASSASDCTWQLTPPSSFTFNSDGAKTLNAFAIDAAGNISTPSIANITIDATLPVVSITSPINDKSVTYLLSVSGTSSDSVSGINNVEVQITDGTVYFSLSSVSSTPIWIPVTGTTNWSLDTSLVNNLLRYGSTYSIKARAIDNFGNVSNISTSSVTIILTDLSAPVISSFKFPAVSSNFTVPILDYSATDNVAVTGYCVIDTDNSSSCNWAATPQSSYIFTTAGSKNIYAFVKDAAGNISASASSSVIIDIIPPVVSAGANQTKSAQFTQTGTASDANSMTYAWSKQTGIGTITFGTPTTLTTSISANTPGTYTIRLTATDIAGNSAFSDMALTWLPDGDMNGDGSVTVADALRALQISVGLITQTANDLAKGDVSPFVSGKPAPDGKINTGDAVVLLGKVAGNISW